MLIEGHVENGRIVLDESTPLPEGARVRVEIVVAPENGQKVQGQLSGQTLAERYAAAFGIAPELPADLAERHP